MKFKELKIGDIFSEDSTCEILKKVSDTESHVVDDEGNIFFDNNKPITYEFPKNHPVEIYEL